MVHFENGTIRKIGDIVDNKGFKKREFILKTDGEKSGLIKFEFQMDNVGVLDSYKVNDEVTVGFYIKGNEWEGKFYTSLISIAIGPIDENFINDQIDKNLTKNNHLIHNMDESLLAKTIKVVSTPQDDDLPF